VLATVAPETATRAVALSIDGRDIALVRPGQQVRPRIRRLAGHPVLRLAFGRTGASSMAASARSIPPRAHSGLFRVLSNLPGKRPWPDLRSPSSAPRCAAGFRWKPFSVGYELWRQLNDFPLRIQQGYAKASMSKDGSGAPGKDDDATVRKAGKPKRSATLCRPAGARWWPLAAAAQQAAPLTLAEVLASSAQQAPQIVEAMARVRQAEGRALTAEGSFDTVFDVDAQSRVLGYYSRRLLEGKASRPLTNNGGSIYGGYRVSTGSFPIYEDKAYTDRLGELKIGGLFAAAARSRHRRSPRSHRHRPRAISMRRGSNAKWSPSACRPARPPPTSELGRRRPAASRPIRRSSILGRATPAAGIARQVQLGARPAILLTEADTNIVRRRALVVRSQQECRRRRQRALVLLPRRDRRTPDPPADRLAQPPASASLAPLGPPIAPTSRPSAPASPNPNSSSRSPKTN